MDPVELKMQSVLKAEYECTRCFYSSLFDFLAPADPAIVIYPGCACASSTNGPVVLPTRLPAVYPSFDLCKSAFRKCQRSLITRYRCCGLSFRRAVPECTFREDCTYHPGVHL